MGATMTGIIEWTHDAQCASGPGSNVVLSRARWEDDHLHGVLYNTDKEYDFFAAVAGVRNRFNKPPLIPLRGLPKNMSIPASNYFEDHGDGVSGWLHLSEIDRCIQHVGADPSYFDFDLKMGLRFMRMLVAELTDPHVRLVFDVESA